MCKSLIVRYELVRLYGTFRGRRADGMGNNDFSWVGALGAVNLFLFAWSATGATDLLAREHGVLEVAQLVLIVLALLIFLIPVFRSSGPAQSAAVALVGVSICCFYRELDLQALGVTGSLAVLSKSSVRDVVLVVALTILLGYVLVQRAHLPAWWRFATRGEAWPLFGAGVLLAIGLVLSATMKGDLQAQFWEELIEFNGYVLFVLAAGRHGYVASYEDVLERPIAPN